jgi:predicted secreted protein
MSWFGALVVFTIVWWLVFFVTLPFGVRRIENPEQGHDAGAPEKPRLLIKAAITTAIAGALTGGLAMAIAYGLIDIRELLF